MAEPTKSGEKLTDPLELYSYPEEWVERRAEVEGLDEVSRKIDSGLYILTPDGWLRRGITTGTTASAAVIAAVASVYENIVREVEVLTPSGLKVSVEVRAKSGVGEVAKFAGDHQFDVTDGLLFKAFAMDRKSESAIEFGKGVGWHRNGRIAVSKAAMSQIRANFEEVAGKYGYEGTVRLEIPEGERVAELTGNQKLGISGGISILGTTGFVEPWCRGLVEVKAAIASQYDRIAVTTGRNGWRWCMENLVGYQPIVFGMYIDEGLKASRPAEDVVLVGKPSLLLKWAEPSFKESVLNPEYVPEKSKLKTREIEELGEKVLRKAREINSGVRKVILLGVGEWE
jgi:cobalt-precorrin-5B (C1)-methyltransferase